MSIQVVNIRFDEIELLWATAKLVIKIVKILFLNTQHVLNICSTELRV